ncbi:MAG TPA: CHAT domain-containing protein [Gemmatimonadales bacterium]|nr:CHAT domain-containing protein [Gemmatimonadales bacterium]
MSVASSAAAAAAAGATPEPSGEHPRVLARAALAAVEGDSAITVAARWQARLRRTPADRAAEFALATLARHRYDYAEAERRYRALATGADAYARYAHLGLAAAADAQGLMAVAEAEFGRALAGARAAQDRAAESEALLGLAFQVATRQGIAAGMAYLDSAGRVLPPDAPDLQADAHRRRAVLLAVQSAPGADAEAAACTRIARGLGALRLEAHCLRAAALDLRLRGAADSSLVVLRQAERLHRRARDRAMLAETLLREVDILRGQGAFGTAKQLLAEGLDEARAAHNLLAVASAHVGLGTLALQVQDYATAAEQLPQAVRLFEQQGDPSGAMIARAFLPTLYAAAGDLAGAAREADSVLAWYRRTGEVSNEFEMLRTRASVAMRARDWARAAAALAAARRLATAHALDDWRAALELDEGRLALYRGALPAAERHLLAYLRGLDSTAHVSRHEAWLRLAEVHARRGELARAAQELARADDLLDRWRATLADDELRVLAFQAKQKDYYEDHASAARVLARLAAGGHVEAAFALAERRRARELADRMAQADALRAGGGADTGGLSARVRSQRGPATAAEVVAALPDERTALLEYVAGTDGAPSTVFVLTRGSVRARSLSPGDSLAGDISRFAALLEAGLDPDTLARRLGAAVLEPALDALPAGVTRLIVVPDGPLHRLPFEALTLRDGRPAITRYAVSLAPSAAVTLALWRRAARDTAAAEPTALLAFGDPAFAGEQSGDPARTATEPFRTAFARRGGLPRLEGSGREAREVARFAPAAIVRLRGEASEAFLKRADLGRFGVIHFATHALVDDATLDRTALALTPGDGEDGFVTPADLADLRLAAGLVVLSACRTADGKVVQGEGVQGLTAPLLGAGAHAVVATRWQVGDRTTVRLMQDFYAALAAGQSVGAALRSAKLAALRRGAPAGEWAAFDVVGDPLTRVALTPPGRTLPRWGGAALGLVLMIAVAAWVRRRRPGAAGALAGPLAGAQAEGAER